MRGLAGWAGFLVAGVAAAALAEPILPPGRYPALDDLIRRHERQFYSFNAYPFGLSLNVHVQDQAARDLIQSFLDQDAQDDFQAFSGVHHHTLMTAYGEHGDLGFFGGVALAGTAFRYLALKREGAPAQVLAEARAAVVRAAQAWHVFYVVTGGQNGPASPIPRGVVARGVVRLVPEDPADPPIPGLESFQPVPLHDAQGNPLPQPKDNGSDREDQSAGLLPPGTWGWIDSASKDQLTGQVLGLVALHDAMKDDPDVDQALVERLAEDARGVGRMLMEKHEISGMEGLIGQGEYDLIILDADGRATKYHDLNPLSFEKFYQPLDSPQFNVLNLVLATGVLRGLHHVTGDPEIEQFLYEEFLGRRGYLDKMRHFDGPDAFNYIYLGLATNTDNPDLASVALFVTLYTETDPEVAAVWRRFLEEGWWAPASEKRFCASKSKQPLWHAIYLAASDRGAEALRGMREELARLLQGFPLAGYWQDPVVNCDDSEVAQGECLAVDGKTGIRLAGKSPDGDWLAEEALDPAIRPRSDFNARSNPFRVNGGGDGRRLNPGGDLLAAYWIARALDALPEGQANLSPFARTHLPVGGVTGGEEGPEAGPDAPAEGPPVPDAGPAQDDLGVAPAEGGESAAGDADAVPVDTVEPGCEPPKCRTSRGGCRAGPSSWNGTWFLLVLMTLLVARVLRSARTRRMP